MLGEQTLRAPLMQRFRKAVQGVWTEHEIGLTLERFAGEVEAAAERDELLWGEARRASFSERRDWTSPAQGLPYLRAWVPARWRQIADELDE